MSESSGKRPQPVLSICIPTYNRRSLVVPLVQRLLSQVGDFEVRIHDDGSADGTAEDLATIGDPRLHITFGENRGRAHAIRQTVCDSLGTLAMIFDDDDTLSETGLQQLLLDSRKGPPAGAIGFIYHMADEYGQKIGCDFPVARENLLRLRLDWKVQGDKKEVVNAGCLKRAVRLADYRSRRVPTSFYWAILAHDGDVICRDIIIGQKIYRAGGMTKRIASLKLENPKPMADLYKAQLRGFFRGRYRSVRMAIRALFAFCWYRLAQVSFRPVTKSKSEANK